jgi:hypothetical protein
MHVSAEMRTLVHTTIQKSVEHSAPTYVLVYREVDMHVHSTSEFILVYREIDTHVHSTFEFILVHRSVHRSVN